MGGGGDVLAEVAEADFDGAEQFVVGGLDEGIDHALQEGGGGGLELSEEALATLVRGFSPFGGRARARSGGR